MVTSKRTILVITASAHTREDRLSDGDGRLFAGLLAAVTKFGSKYTITGGTNKHLAIATALGLSPGAALPVFGMGDAASSLTNDQKRLIVGTMNYLPDRSAIIGDCEVLQVTGNPLKPRSVYELVDRGNSVYDIIPVAVDGDDPGPSLDNRSRSPPRPNKPKTKVTN